MTRMVRAEQVWTTDSTFEQLGQLAIMLLAEAEASSLVSMSDLQARLGEWGLTSTVAGAIRGYDATIQKRGASEHKISHDHSGEMTTDTFLARLAMPEAPPQDEAETVTIALRRHVRTPSGFGNILQIARLPVDEEGQLLIGPDYDPMFAISQAVGPYDKRDDPERTTDPNAAAYILADLVALLATHVELHQA